MDETKNKHSAIKSDLVLHCREVGDEFMTKAIAHAFDTDSAWEELLDEREFKETRFAANYAENFAHGTAGHNRLMLIAKLVKMLDAYEKVLDEVLESK